MMQLIKTLIQKKIEDRKNLKIEQEKSLRELFDSSDNFIHLIREAIDDSPRQP